MNKAFVFVRMDGTVMALNAAIIVQMNLFGMLIAVNPSQAKILKVSRISFIH